MKKLLVVVDMQNDFVSGSLGSKDAQDIVANVVEKVQDAKEEETDIIFTRDTHHENYLETQEGKKLPVVHCVKDTWGWQIIDELKDYAERVIDKPSFGSMELAKFVEEHQYTDIEFVGLCTDICVVSNMMIVKAVLPEAEIVVDSQCCAGVTKESHQSALDTMRMCQAQII